MASRVKVLEFNQKLHEQPKHVVSKTLAKAIILDNNATKFSETLIRLNTAKCFNFVKFSAKMRLQGKPIIPIVSPLPGYEDGAGYGFLPYSLGHDSSSYSQKNFEQLWSSLAMVPSWMKREEGMSEEEWKRQEGLRVE